MVLERLVPTSMAIGVPANAQRSTKSRSPSPRSAHQVAWSRPTTSRDRLKIDHRLKPGRLLDRKIAGLCAAQELGELPAHGVSPQGNNQRPIADQPALLCHLRPLVHRSRSARARSKIKAQLLKTSADAGTLRPSAPAAFAASMALPISSRWATEWIESSMPRARAASSSALRSISCPHLQKVAGG